MAQNDFDLTARRREFHRVVKQVPGDLSEPNRVALNYQNLRIENNRKSDRLSFHFGAHIQAINESSGIAASRCQKNIFWVHNDSGDDAFIFAINAAGDDLGTWKIPGAVRFRAG